MIVCLCHRVSDRDIQREARAGCADFQELQERTRVATACGACAEHASAALEAACGGCTHAARCGGTPLALSPA